MASDVPYKVWAQNAATCSTGRTIVRFQRREAEVLRDGCILDLLDIRGTPKGTLAMLVLHPDGLVDIIDSLVHQMQLRPQRVVESEESV
ncbi:hypothetical protein BHM03_00049187 [Ensete ventricosum]|nr:hypothetical protein BHM03_00049187 [Ensete ventricosum]